LIKQAKFTDFCKQKAIILQLLDPEDVNKIPLPKVTLPVATVPQSTRHESGTSNLPLFSSSPLKTKRCDRYVLTVAPLTDFFLMFGKLLPRNVDE